MKVLVLGGAGYIGSHTVRALTDGGAEVVVFDNLSRKGTQKNLEWLKTVGDFEFIQADIRDPKAVDSLIEKHSDADLIIHLAAQVAVTTSVTDPRTDMEINVIGAFNLLDAIRREEIKPFVIFSSTNKVYGKMDDLPVVDQGGRYEYETVRGIDESRPLEFYSPYGCSKGAADQYVRDWARIYGVPTCVFRMSCIYGPRQFGVEDQGWVAWFIIAAVLRKPITIYGDGKQVRDVLYVEDLIDLYLAAFNNREQSAGNVYNAGGGPENTLSLLELLDHIERRLGDKIPVKYDDWRPGDQKVYISETVKAKEKLGWAPRFDKIKGVDALIDWVIANKTLFE